MDWRSGVVLIAIAVGSVARSGEGANVAGVVEGLSFKRVAEGGGVSSAGSAQNSTPPRPIAELPLSRVTPDATVAVELAAGATLSADALWIPQPHHSSIVRIAASNSTPDTPIAVGGPPCGSLVVSAAPRPPGAPSVSRPEGDVWVAMCGEPSALARVDVSRGNVSPPVPLTIAAPKGTLAFATGSVWVITDAKGVLTRVDPATGAPVAEAYVAARPFAVAAADDVVWVTSAEGDTLTRVDGHTNAIVEAITVGPRPGPLAIGEDAVWTLNRGDGSVTRVDSKSNKVATTIAVGERVAEGAISVGEGAVWVSAPGVPLVRIDPRTNRVTHTFTGEGGGMILAGHGSVWLAAGPGLTWRVDPKLVAALRP
jgi:virginiamycin B lyase